MDNLELDAEEELSAYSELSHPDAIQRLADWLLQFDLNFNTYDLFHVYKMKDSQYKRARYKIYGAAHLRTTEDGGDARRRKLRSIHMAFMSYIFAKALLTALLQSFDTSSGVVYMAGARLNSALEWLMWLIGNPYSSLTDLSYFLYLGVVGYTFWYLVVMVGYYERHPLDMPNMRFLLEPRREIDRVDTKIAHELNRITVSSHLHAYNTLKELKFRATYLDLLEDSNLLWTLLERNNDMLADCAARLSYFRPRAYRYSSFKSGRKCAALLVVMVNMWIDSLLVTVLILFYSPSIEGKCELLGVLDCSPTEAFTVQELVYLIELVAVFFFTSHCYILHQVMFMLLIKSELQLVNDIRLDLHNCLDQLRQASAGQQRETETRSEDEIVAQEERTELMLVEALVRVLVSDSELARATLSMKELMFTFMLEGFLAVSLNFFTAGLQTPTSLLLRHLLLFFVWLSLNMAALVCSYILERATNLEQIYWSILAENSKRDPMLFCTLGSVLWRRLTRSVSATRQRHCAAPFGIKMTYRSILELNFFVVSLLFLYMVR